MNNGEGEWVACNTGMPWRAGSQRSHWLNNNVTFPEVRRESSKDFWWGISVAYILKSFLPPFLSRRKESRRRGRETSFRLSQWFIVQASEGRARYTLTVEMKYRGKIRCEGEILKIHWWVEMILRERVSGHGKGRVKCGSSFNSPMILLCFWWKTVKRQKGFGWVNEG